MAHFLRILRGACILLLWMLGLGMGNATVWTIDNLPMVHLQDARRYVCNPDGVLSQEVVDSLDALLMDLEQRRGVQTVVVAVRQIEGGDAYRFGVDLGNKYGVGSKSQRSGLIVVLATDDRAYFIHTGNGLEGTLPDAICKRVEMQLMVPSMKEGKWDDAIGNGVSALAKYIEGDESLIPEPNNEDDTAGAVMALLIMLFTLAICVSSIYLSLVHKCPKCGKRKLILRKEEVVRVNGKMKLHRHWRCSSCGHEEDTYDDPPAGRGNAMGRSGVPIIFGSGGNFGGGGFSGGSFGGGSFGGGGAGGHF